MFRRFDVCLLLPLTASLAWCQETLTLDQAIATALKNNRLVKVAELDVRKAEEDVDVARS